MNNFLLGFTFLCLWLPTLKIKNNPLEKSISIEQDLFENPVNIKASWLGYLQSARTKKYISNIPMFLYRNRPSAYAKIICIPAKLDNWKAKFKGKSISQKTSITKTLSQGIIGHAFDKKQFAIYAFFQQGNGYNGSDKGNNTNRFPVTIHVYKNIGKIWSPVVKRTVGNRLAYEQLQYDVATLAL
ncbi:hypothetical protein [Pedobacter sp. Leaf176]|uniref:hypothetical protein n=1 Tax=Pedobacter sp. Leaf176 TaxID=1736286 RepID=UPI0006FC5DDD|nr:hypothetical protein [Pedobacter sp. Leaf176]KQR67263.1 hypothetical protein ASF92_16275 [Pedobacter sp. Leaf176]